MQISKKQKEKLRDYYNNLENNFKKHQFILDLYCKHDFSRKNLKTVFDVSINEINEFLKYHNVKKCSVLNCCNPNGRIQSQDNFYKTKYTYDGLTNQCCYCIAEGSKDYQSRNREKTRKRNRDYNKKNFKFIRQKYREKYKWMDKRYKESFSKFDTFYQKISFAEETRRDPNNSELIQVKCTYCNLWFNPTVQQLRRRIRALEGVDSSPGTENRLYCSDECKQSCPIFRKKDYSRDDPRNSNNLGTSREIQPELRQLRFEKDNWTCQKCYIYKGNLAAGTSLHCHHLEGIRHEPMESADIDMCITVCSECHKKIHQIPGCTYQEMQCSNS